MTDDNNTLDSTVADGTTKPTEGRTFTQDEVNRIVQERLAKERNKLNPPPLSDKEQELAEREKTLAQKEFEHSTRDILKENNLPDKILTVLNASDADGLKKALDILDEIFDYRHESLAVYVHNKDGTMKRYRPGDPNMPKFTSLGGSSSASKLPDPIRRGFGLNRKE